MGTSHLVKTQPKDFFLVFLFCVCFLYRYVFFLQNSKFALPGVMIACDRASRQRTKKDRKKERKFISNDIVSTIIYDKRDDFDFEIVNFPF